MASEARRSASTAASRRSAGTPGTPAPPRPTTPANPFVAYDFLDIAEESGCASPRTGWAPQHLAVRDEAGEVAAVAPLYLKSHSQGEYVFDHSWADAYERAGGRYYPKLVVRRAVLAGDRPAAAGARRTSTATRAGGCCFPARSRSASKMDVSTLGVNFPTEDEWRFMGEQGMLLRQNQQYHWLNAGYATFDEFLGALSSGRRKTIRRERRDAWPAWRSTR